MGVERESEHPLVSASKLAIERTLRWFFTGQPNVPGSPIVREEDSEQVVRSLILGVGYTIHGVVNYANLVRDELYRFYPGQLLEESEESQYPTINTHD